MYPEALARWLEGERRHRKAGQRDRGGLPRNHQEQEGRQEEDQQQGGDRLDKQRQGEEGYRGNRQKKHPAPTKSEQPGVSRGGGDDGEGGADLEVAVRPRLDGGVALTRSWQARATAPMRNRAMS